MEREELISKKELLLATGISYGQLYRWKRQRLLPDSWFIKMSTSTGQETFFPKRKVLERIRTILEMKDTHSLDELAEWFHPEAAERMYSLLDVRGAMKLSAETFETCVKVWGRSGFSFFELLLIDLFSELERSGRITREEMEEGLLSAERWTAEFAGNAEEKRVAVLRKRGAAVFLFFLGPGSYRLDDGCDWIGEFDLTERANRLRIGLMEALGEWK